MGFPFGRWLGLVMLIWLLGGCKAVSVVDSWRADDLPGRRFQKLLVVHVSSDYLARQQGEDSIVAELTGKGVAAVASRTLLPAERAADKEQLADAVTRSGADGIISIQLLHVERHTSVEPGHGAWSRCWPPYPYATWDLYHYYGAGMYCEPGNLVTRETLTIQANLFEAASGRLLWAVTLETEERGRALAEDPEFAKIIVYGLMKEGLI